MVRQLGSKVSGPQEFTMMVGAALCEALRWSGGVRWKEGERCVHCLWFNPHPCPLLVTPFCFLGMREGLRRNMGIPRGWGEEEERQGQCCLCREIAMWLPTLFYPPEGQDLGRQRSFYVVCVVTLHGLAGPWYSHRGNNI